MQLGGRLGRSSSCHRDRGYRIWLRLRGVRGGDMNLLKEVGWEIGGRRGQWGGVYVDCRNGQLECRLELAGSSSLHARRS